MAYANGYGYRKALTVDHLKVSGGADLVNFPALVSVTDAALATTANGGRVTNASGWDIRFELADGTKLDHEIELWSATTGQLIAWVRIPTLSASVDTTFYVYYGSAGIGAPEANATGVWSAYKAVYHLGDSTGLALGDSTANANNAVVTGAGAAVSAVAGQIGNAAAAGGGQYLDGGAAASCDPGGTAVLTLQAWVRRGASNTAGGVIERGVPAQGGWVLAIGVSPGTINQVKVTKYGVADIVLGAFPADTALHKLDVVYSSTGIVCYVDGASNGTSTNSALFKTIASNLVLGGGQAGTWNGSLDELRVLTVTRSGGWITTEWNNQSAPATFMSVGPEQVGPASIIVPRLSAMQAVQRAAAW